MLHSVRSLLLRKHKAICIQFDCCSRSHVTEAFVLFHGALLLSMSVMESFDPALTSFRCCKRLSCYVSFPTLLKVCLEPIGDLIFGMQRMLSEVLFSPSAINPVSAQVWSSIHFGAHCCIVTVTFFITTSDRVLHKFTGSV